MKKFKKQAQRAGRSVPSANSSVPSANSSVPSANSSVPSANSSAQSRCVAGQTANVAGQSAKVATTNANVAGQTTMEERMAFLEKQFVLLLETLNSKQEVFSARPESDDDTPQAQRNVPQTSNNVPPTSNNVPQTSNNAPPTSNNVPQAYNDAHEPYNDAVEDCNDADEDDADEDDDDEDDAHEASNNVHQASNNAHEASNNARQTCGAKPDAFAAKPEKRAAKADAASADILHAWLTELKEVNARYEALLPELGSFSLSHAERLRLSGSGVRRYGYIDVVSDTAAAYPKFWPACGNDTDTEQMKSLIRIIESLKNLRLFFDKGTRRVQDLLLLRGDQSYRLANRYYVAVREAARYQLGESETVWNHLRLYWKRKRKSNAEPTQKNVVRDAIALMRGTKEGTVCVSNTSDRVVQGVKTVVDETTSVKQRGGMKVAEVEKME